MFEETLYQSSAGGTPFVDILREQGIVPGIKVDTGLQVSGHACTLCLAGCNSVLRNLMKKQEGWLTWHPTCYWRGHFSGR